MPYKVSRVGIIDLIVWGQWEWVTHFHNNIRNLIWLVSLNDTTNEAKLWIGRCGLSESNRINVFWTLVKDFVDTWFQVILWSFVRWSCSYFVSAHIRESKTGWLIAIWQVYASDQCFLDFGEGFHGYLISLNFTKFCLQKLLTLCFSTN